MQFDFMTLEVDGSLGNPLVAATVSTWAVVMACAAGIITRAWLGNHANHFRLTPRRVLLVIVTSFLFFATSPIQFLMGNLFYYVASVAKGGPRITSVGFWGGPPVWPAWVCAVLSAAVVVLAFRRRAVKKWVAPGA